MTLGYSGDGRGFGTVDVADRILFLDISRRCRRAEVLSAAPIVRLGFRELCLHGRGALPAVENGIQGLAGVGRAGLS